VAALIVSLIKHFDQQNTVCQTFFERNRWKPLVLALKLRGM